MPHILIRQRFADYAQWREAFDSLTDRRTELGLRPVVISTNRDQPDETVVVFEVEDMDRAMTHFGSPELAEATRRAGVLEGSTQATFLRDPS